MRPDSSDTDTGRLGTAAFLTLLAGVLGVGIGWAGEVAPAAGEALPPVTSIVGPERCGECHKTEFEAWQASRHASSFKSMHRQPEAKAIAGKLGVRRIKSTPLCMECHYTPMERKGKTRAGCGVSCESCHGPASGWLAVHDDFGSKDVNRVTEPLEHRTRRIAESRAHGMQHPEFILELASQCYRCHSIADEKLVNLGGHPTGDGFELVSWSQGEVRHNFCDSDGAENARPSQARKRLLFIVGQLLDLEHALLAVAVATEPGEYLEVQRRRVETTVAKIAAIDEVLGDSIRFAPLLESVRSLPLEPGSAATLTGATERVRSAARFLLQGHDGNDLGAVDPLMPGPEKIKGAALGKS